MPHVPLLSGARRSGYTFRYVPTARSVPSLPDLLPPPSTVAAGIGLARVVLGGSLLLAPATAVRALGMDTATAKRVGYLARMAAVRDVGLGVGTLGAGSGRAVAPWLLAGAAADAVDAVVVIQAARHGVAGRARAAAVAVLAGAGAALGVWAALGSRR